MSLNTSPLGVSSLQISTDGAGVSDGGWGKYLNNGGSSSYSSMVLGGNSRNDNINQLAGLLTGMMMMMFTGGGGLGGSLGRGLGTTGSTLGVNTGTGSGSSLDQTLGLQPVSYGDSSTYGSGSSSGMSPMEQLMKIFAEIMQSMFGDQDGSSWGSRTGSQPTKEEQNAYNKGVTDALTSLMGNGLSQSNNSSLGGGNGSVFQGLQNMNDPANFQQFGNAVGAGVGMKAGIEALNNIGTHSDSSTRCFINKEDREMAKEVGQFMDQYSEIFGKPQYQKNPGSEPKHDTKSWAEALCYPDDDGMTPASLNQFNKAKGIIKCAMEGDYGNSTLQARGSGGSSLGTDATLAGDTINNMALRNLSVA